MNELRWILLLVGVLLVAGVFFYTRWQQTRKETDEIVPQSRHEPSYADNILVADEESNHPSADMPLAEDDDFLADVISTPSPQSPAPSPLSDDSANQKIFTVHIMAPEGSTFAAQEVVEVLQAAGMKYGKYGIFHLDIPVGGAARTIFSAADMVEPGTFDLSKLDDNWLIGITLFMVLPGPRSGVDAFAKMLATARQLAEKLDGEVVDSSHSSLTRQTAHHMREQIIAFEAKTH